MSEPSLIKVPTEVQGRVLLEKKESSSPQHLVLALHGYGESSEHMISRLRPWVNEDLALACVEALHPIYLPNRKIGHSWMTSHLREEAIIDNLKYIERTLVELRQHLSFRTLTVLGYSQGAQMAMRVVRWLEGDHLIAIGGELPPELLEPPLWGTERLPKSAFLAKGKKDLHLPSVVLNKNLEQWTSWGCPCSSIELPGAHRWLDTWANDLEEAKPPH